MRPIDFALIVLIFGEFFLFIAIASYLTKRWEKRQKTKPTGFPFYEAVWTKSKMVVTVYEDHFEISVPSSRVEIERRVKEEKEAPLFNSLG
ncbi:MAG: hypothetical protein JSV15_01015 [Candidatus Bathyarchaeota archaeon]|nr:MAG: hypothetical protein JSV15_01015 [Candidatus Bathyarchaeota archaeon]